MHIKILGPGCGNCHTLERLTREALTDLGVTADVTSVTDYAAILGYGVMSTPALVVDDEVVLSGRVPSQTQIRGLLHHRVEAHATTEDHNRSPVRETDRARC